MGAQMRGGREPRDTKSHVGDRNDSCSLGRVTAQRERVGEFLQTHTHTHKCLKKLH